MLKLISRIGQIGSVCFLLVASSTIARAEVTPFSIEVYEAIEAGIDWLIPRQAGDGNISGWGTGVCTLAILEQPTGPDWASRPRGYVGLEPRERTAVDRAAAWMVRNQWAQDFYGYGTGATSFGLASYLATGGPDDVGEGRTVLSTLERCVTLSIARRGTPGYWNYRGPESPSRGDLSVTRFVVLGLSAAQAFVPEAADMFPGVAEWLVTHSLRADGGHGYRPSYSCGTGCSSQQMSAAGLFSMRMAGLECTDASVQRTMRWFHTNYTYQNCFPYHHWDNAYFYYLWGA